jgi:7-cyano-7-deazaguanine tRNA-ribosyltransferase
MRAHGHPTLLQAVKRLKKYQNFIEKHDPAVKNSGLFFFNSVGLIRPEVMRHKKKLTETYTPPRKAKILLLAPQTRAKPFHKSKAFAELANKFQHILKEKSDRIHTCFYAAPFGIIPMELDEVYPLSQHEIVLPLDRETVEYVTNQVFDYINRTSYETVMLLNDSENWEKSILNACKKACLKKNIKFKCINTKMKQNKTVLAELEKILLEK